MSEGLRKVKSFFKAPELPKMATVAPEQKVEKIPVLDDVRARNSARRQLAALDKSGGRASTMLTPQQSMGSQSPTQVRSGLAASSVITG